MIKNVVQRRRMSLILSYQNSKGVFRIQMTAVYLFSDDLVELKVSMEDEEDLNGEDDEEEEEEGNSSASGGGEGNSRATCGVCELPTPKTRVHYGGVSCYSCRAFFRLSHRLLMDLDLQKDRDFSLELGVTVKDVILGFFRLLQGRGSRN